jgi:diguanylate cyclase (GGDEF)-like protein
MDAEENLKRERLIYEATMQSVINGIVFINNRGIIEKINKTFEKFFGPDMIKCGNSMCELQDGNIMKEIFLKPLELGACWEIKNCGNEKCPAYGRKDCLCWLMETPFCYDESVTDKYRHRVSLECDVYRNAYENYYTLPLEIEYGGRFFYVYRRNVADDNGFLIGEILDFVDMTTDKNYQEQLKILSITDDLTGVYNRRFLSLKLTDEFYKSKRYNHTFSVMMADIDNFKQINDTFGHHAGDVVIKEIAKTLQREKRLSDIVGRYGGEEFVVVMPHIGADDAFPMAERIRKSIEAHAFGSIIGHKHVTVSIGIASIGDPMAEADDLLRLADEALYKAKSGGKNKTVII